MTTVLVGIGVLVAAAASLAMLIPREPLDQLHFVTPVTSIAAPLIGIGLAIANGFSLTSGTILLTVAIVALTSPILGAATGRMVRDTEERP